MENSILDIYCRQMTHNGKSKQLTPAETEAYFTAYQEVCQELDTCDPADADKVLERKRNITEKITSSCLAYVLRIANNYAKGSDDRDLLLELLAEGNLGLCIAVTKYDWKKGVPFHNYAAFWIRANYQTVVRSSSRMVKNSESVSVYYQGFAETQKLPDELQETVDDDSTIIQQTETAIEVRKFLQKVDPLSQAVFRLRDGFVLDKGFKFTQIGRMFGKGFSANVAKALYKEASDEISTALRSSSCSSEGISWPGSSLHV